MAKRKKNRGQAGRQNAEPHAWGNEPGANTAAQAGQQPGDPEQNALEDALINEVWGSATRDDEPSAETIPAYLDEDAAWPDAEEPDSAAGPTTAVQAHADELTEVGGPGVAPEPEATAPETATSLSGEPQSEEVVSDVASDDAGAAEPSAEDGTSEEPSISADPVEPELPNDASLLAAAMDAAESGSANRKRKRKPAKAAAGAASASEDSAVVAAGEEAPAADGGGDAHVAAEASEATGEPVPDNVVDLFGANPKDPDAPVGDELDPEDDLPLEGLDEGLERLEGARLESVVESLLFASDKLVTMADLRRLTNVRDTRKIQKALDDLKDRRLESGIILVEAAGSFRLQTNPINADWVGRMVQGKPVRLSRAMMETLAIVAYKQPITRPEVDDIRGVDCGPVLRTLLDRNLVRVIGKKEDVGRPLLYGTTPEFLKTFSLSDLTELPTLREFHELGAEESQKMKQTFGDDPAAERATAEGPQSENAGGEPAAAPAVENAATKRTDGLKGDRPSAFSNKTVADVPEDDSLIEELERATEAASRALDAGKKEPGSPVS